MAEEGASNRWDMRKNLAPAKLKNQALTSMEGVPALNGRKSALNSKKTAEEKQGPETCRKTVRRKLERFSDRNLLDRARNRDSQMGALDVRHLGNTQCRRNADSRREKCDQ
jgi:hypothetical protein